ncbi:MAG: adenosylhomocysteinase [Candidatus Omnitrophica bacterium]|nr:adenosylhomocysteinase [Candidatus Omnitrophota bacterium]
MVSGKLNLKSDVKDIGLAADGARRVEWAARQMPVLKQIRERFGKERPLKGIRMAACLHVTTETANLMQVMKAGGAEIVLCASNPLSTQDDASAFLVKEGITVCAIKGESKVVYAKHLNTALDLKPHITMDDGADLVSELHGRRKNLVGNMLGGAEETTTGVIRLRSLEAQKRLLFPVIGVNDADTKHFFDNRYGTGQSTIDGILRATNLLMAGSTFVVCGYGQCGRGLAVRAKGMGAHVIVTEINPLRALEAVMDGYVVMPAAEAAKVGDVFVTVTGNAGVIRTEHFKTMKDGVVVANSGHFDVELDMEGLRKIAKRRREVRPFVEEFTLADGRKINVLAEGRLVNLVSAEGHPAMVMDMSFANQALSAEYLVKHHGELEKKVYAVPKDIDREIARIKLNAMGVKIDQLTPYQKKYLSSWELGTI